MQSLEEFQQKSLNTEMPDKINLIYLMGAGRSGTTALATFLGGHPDIEAIGEMHQFFDHLAQKKTCSCGKNLTNCRFWSEIIEQLPNDYIEKSFEFQNFCQKFDYHTSVPKHILGFNKKQQKKYNEIQSVILSLIKQKINSFYLLDSAKYIGRNISLKKNNNLTVKTIYLVRDVRGVINSFKKKVQSSRGTLSTIFYYLIVNLTAEVYYRFLSKKSIIKIKYEDFTVNPEQTLERIGKFLELDMDNVITRIKRDDKFAIGHIIGGNRLKQNESIKLKSDILWKKNQSRLQQIIYYILASPIMLINRYKI